MTDYKDRLIELLEEKVRRLENLRKGLQPMKNKAIAFILVLGMLLCFFTGCSKATKVIADTDTVYIARTGTETLIIDRTADKEYTYRTTRVKKENAPTESKTSQKTDTIEIVLLPGGSMEITDIVGGKVYTIHRKGLF